MTALERIWASADLRREDQGRWWDSDPGGDAMEYIRADLIPAALAVTEVQALQAERDALREALFVYGDRSKMGRTLRASLEAYGKANPTRQVDMIIAALRGEGGNG